MKRLIALMMVSLVLLLAGCETSALQQADNDKREAANSLAMRHPVPKVTYSIERENIIHRIRVTNDAKQVGWVYLLANDGAVVARFPVRGKVTSGSKRLTRTEMYETYNGSHYRTEAPDEMGAYGSSNPYIFFFTPNGMLVQWQGDYLYTSEPYKLNPQTKTIEYTVDPEEMAKVAAYKAQIEATPLDKAKGGQ